MSNRGTLEKYDWRPSLVQRGILSRTTQLEALNISTSIEKYNKAPELRVVSALSLNTVPVAFKEKFSPQPFHPQTIRELTCNDKNKHIKNGLLYRV